MVQQMQFTHGKLSTPRPKHLTQTIAQSLVCTDLFVTFAVFSVKTKPSTSISPSVLIQIC